MGDEARVDETAERAADEQSSDLEQLRAELSDLRTRLEKRSKDPARVETFFVGFAVALAPGVALAFMGIEWFRDNVTSLATGVLIGLVAVAALTVVLFLFRVEIMRALRLRAGVQIRQVVAETAVAVRSSMPGSSASEEEAEAAIERAGQSMASWYSWVSARRAAVWIMLGLLSTFALFIGESLIFEQNELIRQQNLYFREQNAKIQKQLDDQAAALKKQEEDTLLVRKNELLRTIYETQDCDLEKLPEDEARCPPVHPLRLRQEAVIALAEIVERPNLSGADLSDAILIGADLTGADLRGANLRRTDLTGASLFRANLFEANLRRSDLRGADLSVADLRLVDLFHANLFEANLRAANLRGADLSVANLGHADLSNANLRFADLRGAIPFEANLSDAILTGADLFGANLSHARQLTPAQLMLACGDSDTKLPEGISRPGHWLDRPRNLGYLDAGCPPKATSE